MLRPVEAMDGKIVQPLALQPLEDALQLSLTLLEGHAWQQFAGDHPASIRWLRAAL